jgi:tetratricopeptide (TPR) repeat protein
MGLAVCAAPVAIAADSAYSPGVSYICSAERTPAPAGSERKLVMVSGVGTGGFAIATAKPEAQAWFNYGMALAHAFYHDDAILAFKRARDIDPDCAMCAWGEAWAEGPTINYDIDPAERRAAGGVADRAAALDGAESPKNRALIDALKVRYSGPGPAADTAFAKAMDALSRRYADDDEIAIMTSDAWLMLAQQHDDSQGVTRAVAVLEPVLARHPDNTGAIHFYIHATEIAGDPARALPFADRLGALAPGASHLVHMASHTFFRVGRYEDAAVVNAQAIGVDGDYLRASHDPTIQGRVRYHAHDLRFGLAGAMASGDAPLALRLADHQAYAFPNSISTEGGSQVAAASADFAYGRYAPARALALADPGPKAPFAAALRHYARGEAYASLGDPAKVMAEASQVEAATGAADATPGYFQKSARAILRMAALTLRGRAAMLRGQPKAAEIFYDDAVAIQDADLSFKGAFDPPPWWYPERRSLAAAQLAAGNAVGAASTARAALKSWPREPLTLEVLGRAEQAAGQDTQAARDLAEASRTWRGSSVGLARM